MVVDRCLLDARLAEKAVDAGAELRTSTRFVSREGSGSYLVRSDRHREVVTSKVIVGADGYRSEVAKVLGLPPCRDLVKGVEVDVDRKMEDQERVRVWLGSKVAPGFFAWAIPCGDFTRVGLCVKRGSSAPSAYLDSLLKTSDMDGKVLARYSGQIPLGVRQQTCADGGLVVGDAAGQAKPISGGGVYTAFVAAQCAADAISKALVQGDVSRKSLAAYEKQWRAELGKELENGYRARRIFVSMKDQALDKAGALLSEDKPRAVLSTGDIDHPMELASRLIRAAPGLVALLPMALRPLLFE
jgi:flavin-dependent dehydrogenase